MDRRHDPARTAVPWRIRTGPTRRGAGVSTRLSRTCSFDAQGCTRPMTDTHVPNLEEERALAHTGALARMAGHFAHHPWRVIFGWIGIFVVLIGLNAAFHGKLINDFNIPGSDVQKATDLINAKFGGQKGAALRVVLAAPTGERLDTPQRQAAIRQMLAAGKTSQRSLDESRKDVNAITDPV